MSNPDMLERVTATLRDRRKVIADAVTKNTALLAELRRKGAIKPKSGGRTLSAPIMYDENANFMFYGGTEALSIAPQEVLTSAEYAWKQYACGVSISNLELLMNSGTAQVIDIMKARILHAEKTIANQMHRSSYSDGTGSFGKEFGGLRLLISTGAGATVGGINAGLAAWWENKRTAIGAPAVGTIYGFMLDMCLSLQRGIDKTDLIISDNTFYSVFNQSQVSLKRYQDKQLADAGFRNLLFEGIPVVAEGGDGGYAPAGMFFLDTSTIEMNMHSKRNNVVLSGPRRPVYEDSETVIIAGMGNFTSNNRARNGRMYV